MAFQLKGVSRNIRIVLCNGERNVKFQQEFPCNKRSPRKESAASQSLRNPLPEPPPPQSQSLRNPLPDPPPPPSIRESQYPLFCQGPPNPGGGGFKRGGFPIWTCLSFFVLCGTFPICLGFSRFVRGLFGDFPDLSFSSFSAH